MRFLKIISKTLGILIVVAALGAGAYYVFLRPPCSSPITYRVGTIDPKFGVTQAQFLADINNAAQIWDKPFSKTFFAYDPNGTVVVNLIYDNRQATVDTNKTLSANVDQTVASADTLKAQLTTLKAQYASAQSAYQAYIDQYQTQLDSYNSETQYWNDQGGAPQGEYEKLQQEDATLQSEETEANAKLDALNVLGDQVNALVGRYNALVDSANSVVTTINKSADQQFEEGEYISDNTGQRINIYEFQGTNELVRVLAHELGHALGLDHNSDPASIMYYLNQGTNLDLSAEDKAAVKAECRLP